MACSGAPIVEDTLLFFIAQGKVPGDKAEYRKVPGPVLKAPVHVHGTSSST